MYKRQEGVDNVPHGLYEFLSSMPSSSKNLPHGTKYHYCSPHSDLLGWIVERICGDIYYNILSELLISKDLIIPFSVKNFVASDFFKISIFSSNINFSKPVIIAPVPPIE